MAIAYYNLEKNVANSKALATAGNLLTTSYQDVVEDSNDDRFVIALHNSDVSNAINVTIQKGDNATYGALSDLVISVSAGALVFLSLDSAKYMNLSAKAYKIKAATASKVYVYPVVLP